MFVILLGTQLFLKADRATGEPCRVFCRYQLSLEAESSFRLALRFLFSG